jgi:hypothetical protein
MNNLKTRIEESRKRAEQAKQQAYLKRIEQERSADEIEARRSREEEEKLISFIEDFVQKIEDGSKVAQTVYRIDLPLKGLAADFEYRQGCQPDFVFKKDSFTDKVIKLLTNELNLQVKPSVYRHVDVCAYDRDVTYKYWLEVRL